MILILIIIIIIYFVSKISIKGGDIDDFPYLYKWEPIDEIKDRFNRLGEYKPTVVHKDFTLKNIRLLEIEKYYLPIEQKYINISNVPYFDINLIADWFTQPCRIKAKLLGQPTMYDWWQNNKKKFKTNDLKELHELVYEAGPKQVTNFKPVNMTALIDLFESKDILDFSAGWGDRLVASTAKKVNSYIGVDPNKCLHPLYNEIIKELNVNTKVTMIESPFETAKLPPNTEVDLIFTSPPYFALEIYSEDEGQSHKHGKLDSWYNNFLMVSLNKAWTYLKVGGYMAININDYGINKYCQKMVKDFSFTPDALYQGVIVYDYSLEGGNPQPIWIWKKIEIETIQPESYRILDINDEDIKQKTIKSKLAETRPIILVEELTPITFELKMHNANVITTDDYNPPFIIKNNIIQDNILPGGTKQRGLVDYLLTKSDNIIYCGSSDDYNMISIAWTCWLLDKNAKFLIHGKRNYKMINLLESYGAEIKFTESYKNSVKKAKSIDGFLVPAYLDDDEFIDYLHNNIKKHFNFDFNTILIHENNMKLDKILNIKVIYNEEKINEGDFVFNFK